MVAKASLPVDALRPRVYPIHFEMERRDSFLTTHRIGQLKARFPDPAPAKILAQIKFVNKGVAPAKLKTEAERDDEITRRRIIHADQMNDPEPAVVQNLPQRNARRPFVKPQMLDGVKLPHQLDEEFNVRRVCRSKDGFHRNHFDKDEKP